MSEELPAIWVGVMHAAFAPGREKYLEPHERMRKLTGWPWHIERDETERGPVDVAMSIWRKGLCDIEQTELRDRAWIVLLNDDVVFARDFAEHLLYALESAPSDIVCLYNNHPRAREAFERQEPYYQSFDGIVSVGCAMQYWAAIGFVEDVDSGIILPQKNAEDSMLATHAMMRGVPITHTVPALVDHAAPDASLLGHEHHEPRHAVVGKGVWKASGSMEWWTRPVADVPPVVTYHAMVDNVVLGVRPDRWAECRCVEELIAMKREQRRQCAAR